MLRPEQIRIHHFTLTNKGTYKAEEVEAYMTEVLTSYEQMFRENGELVRKIGLLAERVEEYRRDEDNIRAALLTAQRMADKIQKDANEQTAQQIQETNEQTTKQIQETNEKTAQQIQEANRLAETTVSQAQERAQNMLTQAKQKSEMAVVASKTEAARILTEVESRAKAILKDANDRAQAALLEQERKMTLEQQTLMQMREEAAQFKADLMEAYQQQIELIEKLPRQLAAQQLEQAQSLTEEQYRAAVYSPMQEREEQPEQKEETPAKEITEETVQAAVEEAVAASVAVTTQAFSVDEAPQQEDEAPQYAYPFQYAPLFPQEEAQEAAAETETGEGALFPQEEVKPEEEPMANESAQAEENLQTEETAQESGGFHVDFSELEDTAPNEALPDEQAENDGDSNRFTGFFHKK